MNRAYSIIEVKSLDEGKRIFRGWATTPETDRSGDIINPLGASFNNPLVLLHQHDSERPIGTVKFKKPTKDGIEFEAEIPNITEPGLLKDRVDMAWGEIKSGLVRAVSIGFRAIKYAFMETGGIDFQEIEIYELSAVSIPANAGAIITDVKSIKRFDTAAPAATGTKARPTNVNPPAAGKSIKPISIRPQEGQRNMIKNVGAQIADLEAKRKETATAMEAIQTKSSAENRTKDADERKQFDDLRAELKTIDAEIKDLKDIEAIHAPTAQPVDKGADPAPRPYQRMTPMASKKPEPGILFAQQVKVQMMGTFASLGLGGESVIAYRGLRNSDIAMRMYGEQSRVVGIFKSGEQVPGSTTSGNWGADLVSPEGSPAADFAEYLRPATILGKFGQNGVPSLRSVPFRKPLIQQTAGGTGYWVGEGKPIGVTQLNFDRSTLDPVKCGTIAVLTMENVRDSSPSSDAAVRDDLRDALAKLEDDAFITPTNAGTSGSKPAGILYTAGADFAIAAESYTDESDVILDIRSLLARYDAANNPAETAVLVMRSGTARAAGLILNSLGQRAFPGVGAKGGTLLDIPVITSENVPAGIVAILNAQDVLRADDGDVTVDMNPYAAVEMKSGGNLSQDGLAGTGASLVSLWQNDMIALRALHTVNWKRRRDTIGAYLTGVAWGGTVNAS